MCGIAGIAGPGVGGGLGPELDAMLATLAQRGPDERGHLTFPNCVLAHTRLSILDLSTGSQPMYDREANIAITFNGEIYNFLELRRELEAQGHVFLTRSDTEVILKAYLQYGPACVERLDGMFAFGLWDETANRLVLARDRFGKKPLYYAFDNGGALIFGSELKTLLASGRVPAAIDYETMDSYLRLQYVPPDRTIYRNVHVVRPAETVVVASGRVSTRCYWTLRQAPLRIPYAEAKEEVRRLMADAVRKRMVADVEIGALLSGGVDSTIVTHFAQQFASHPVKTFSVGYGDFINELPYSEAAATTIGTDHHVLQVGGATLGDELVKVAAYFDEPHADSSNVAQCLVSALARTKVKVALCGDGGDEVFLGYEWYWRHWQGGRRERLRQALLSDPFRDYVRAIQAFSPEHRKLLWNGHLPAATEIVPHSVSKSRLRSVQAINMFDLSVYLPGQLLVKADRAGMMHSLEVRSPLLDYRLAEFVVNLPIDYKTDRRAGKLILKDLLREVMPPEFVDRPKQGFGAPVADWLRSICRPLVRDLLDSPNAGVYDCFNRAYIAGMVERFYAGQDSSDSRRIWALLCLELWFSTHRSHRPGVTANAASA